MTPLTDRQSAALFDRICREALIGEHERKGIGTLGERVLHVILKRFYEQNPEYTEKKVGRFVADICRGERIVEVQTRDFRRLREKLPEFLADHTVKVVYPIAHTKYIRWLDPETGELSERHKSPKHGSIYDFLLELYLLRPILPELRERYPDGLSFDLVYVCMEEYKLLTGRSRDRKHYGASRCERIPTELLEIVTLETPQDFMSAIPDSLPEEFTSTQLAKEARLSRGAVGKVIAVLTTLGVIGQTGKLGRSYLYSRML